MMTSSCPYCPAVLQHLGQLLKEGALSRLEAVNIERAPERAQQFGVRSVPWIRIGDFELDGNHGLAELREWSSLAGTRTGSIRYLTVLLKHGQRQRALERIRRLPLEADALIALLEDPEIDLGVRLGADAIIEDLAGSEILAAQLDRLAQLSRHDVARLRCDACHYLGLTGLASARPHLEARLADDDEHVRSIAAEALAELGKTS